MIKPGIQWRLLGAAFIMIFGATVLLDFIGVHLTRQFMHKRFHDRISFLSKYLALNSELGVLINDRVGLKSLALNLLGEDDVAQVTIYDNQGEKLVHQTREVPGRLYEVETPVVLTRSGDENVLFKQFQTPFGVVERSGREFLGRVRIKYSSYGIERLIHDMTTKFFWLSMGLAAVAGLVFYLIARPIVNEVKELADIARQVGSGDLSLRVRPGRVPETRSLAMDFNGMLDSLQRSREALDHAHGEMLKQTALAEVGRFSLIVAHEVKNPLSIIKSSVDVLKKEIPRTQFDTMVWYIEDEIQRLNRLIEDFLIFARPSKPNLRPVDLNRLLSEMIDRFKIQYTDADIHFEVLIPDAPVWREADADLLSRSFGNILKNGCEAVNGAGTIRIQVQRDDHNWNVEIADNGSGIAPGSEQELFEPFFTTRSKGTGLGLAFVDQVVKSHQGKVWAEKSDLGGAAFRVSLPVPSA